MQSQRTTADKEITVDRMFFFPSGIISSLFPELKATAGGNLEVTENTGVEKDELDYIKKLLYFQHCLGINVKLLSPDIVSGKTMKTDIHTQFTDIAKQWTSCDFAILAADSEQCMIEIQAFDSLNPTTFLLAKDGQVHFKASKIEKQLKKYNILSAMGIDLSALIASDKSECDKLHAAVADIANLPDAIESITKLLKK